MNPKSYYNKSRLHHAKMMSRSMNGMSDFNDICFLQVTGKSQL